jgi:hypothetical protein
VLGYTGEILAVLIEAISIVTRADSILSKFNGGWEAFESCVPNETMCADGEIARIGFMTPTDVESFVKKLERSGLIYLSDGEAIDIAVADQMRGLATPCKWLEFGRVNIGGNPGQRVGACRFAGGQCTEIVTPPGWAFERSLSHTYGFIPSEHLDKSMTFLRHENGLDIYLNTVTGQEMYVGRTGEV